MKLWPVAPFFHFLSLLVGFAVAPNQKWLKKWKKGQLVRVSVFWSDFLLKCWPYLQVFLRYHLFRTIALTWPILVVKFLFITYVWSALVETSQLEDPVHPQTLECHFFKTIALTSPGWVMNFVIAYHQRLIKILDLFQCHLTTFEKKFKRNQMQQTFPE